MRIPALLHAQPQLVVLGERAVGVAAQLLDRRAPEHHRRVRKGRLDIDIVGDLRGRDALVLPPQIFAIPLADMLGREQLDLRAQQRDLGVLIQVGELRRQALRMHQVVGVHAGDQRGAGLRNPQVQRGDQAHAAGLEQANPLVLLRRSPNDRRRVVGRAIVDRQQLEVAERLALDRLQAVGQRGGGVAERQNDRDRGRALHHLLIRLPRRPKAGC